MKRRASSDPSVSRPTTGSGASTSWPCGTGAKRRDSRARTKVSQAKRRQILAGPPERVDNPRVCEDKGVERGGEIEPRFYTLEQTASYLNVSVPQVYSLVHSGRLPAIKIGGRGQWRVPVAS